jgi:hypothetical protein
MPTEPKNANAWDLSAIGGRAFTEVQEGADVSSVVASALFQRQPDEWRILSELGKASQLFVPYEPGKENVRRQDVLWDLSLSVRGALGLHGNFIPNVQLSKSRRLRAIRQVLHLCTTVMIFDITLAIPDAWEEWLQHCHLTDDELREFVSFDIVPTAMLPAVMLRPTASLFTLFQDAHKLAEPGRGRAGASHPHRMVWDAYRPTWQLLDALYQDPRLRRAHGYPEAVKKRKYGGISLVSFSSAHLFMLHATLKRKALDNPPPDGLLSLGAYMPRSPFTEISSGILRYLNDETDELPYASEKCSLENPLGLLTVSPKAHKEKHWCAGVVPVDLTGWPTFTDLQERGFYKIEDPRNVDALELHRQVGVMALEVLGPKIWHIS